MCECANPRRKYSNDWCIYVLCFALTVFAQERQKGHENFTVGQRFATFGMNIIPGLGSAVIMDDWVGAGIQWALTGASIALVADIAINGRYYLTEWHDPNHKLLKVIAAFYISSANILFNITRSVTYDNPSYVQQLLWKNGNENFTVGQRFATFGMNIIPGLGSIVIMDDWAGAITQWGLVGLGIASIDSSGIILIGYNILFNIYRSATYNNLKNVAFGKDDGFHLSVLPNRYGKIMPYLLFSKAF